MTAGWRTPGPLRVRNIDFSPSRLLVMAIVNRTPDSFFRPGQTWDAAAALDRVHEVVAEGADIVDAGGVPAKPGSEVTPAEEIRRVTAFIEAVRAAYPDLVISVDTWRNEVGRAACEAGGGLAERHLGRLGPSAGGGRGKIRCGPGVLSRGWPATTDQAVPHLVPGRYG